MVITGPTRANCLDEYNRIDRKFKAKLIEPRRDPGLPDTDLYDMLGQ